MSVLAEPGGGGLLQTPLEPAERGRRAGRRAVLFAVGALVILAVVRVVTGDRQLTTSGTFGATLRLAVPILLAGLGAVFAERAGVINIGLEGMMILGTWFGAWAGVEFGPWWGAVIGMLGGAAGGLLHAVATVTFTIDHVVSGVAINILAAGVARFLSVIFFTGRGGGATQSPQVEASIGKISLPFVAGGSGTPDLFGWLERQEIFLVSDFGALLKGVTSNLSWLTVMAFLLVPLTFYVLWRTAFGLRLRSVGEHPVAAESLGVPVYRMKYAAVVISGGLAGLGGAYLVLEAARIYREGQVAGRGFIGLAALIFGNWRPGGVLAAAGLFGYADGLRLRGAATGVLLFVAFIMALAGLWMLFRRRRPLAAVALFALAGLMWLWWASIDTLAREFVGILPHITTLVVLAIAAQRLRPPAADGVRYRKGQST